MFIDFARIRIEAGVVITCLHDDKKSPFLHSKTPKWLLQFKFGDFGLKNNIVERSTISEGERFELISYIHEYDNDGYPTKRIAVKRDKDDNETRIITTFEYEIRK